jgi:hypothetical protein
MMDFQVRRCQRLSTDFEVHRTLKLVVDDAPGKSFHGVEFLSIMVKQTQLLSRSRRSFSFG